MSAGLIGIGIFFPLREAISHGAALSIAATLAFLSAAALYAFASKLSSRAARAGVGLTLVFGAICFGVRNDGQFFAIAVLWAGVLFGALDSLGKLPAKRSLSIDSAKRAAG